MSASPLVSVVIAVYNEEEYIDTAIKSILNQTYENFEFLIVDDGSSDSTVAIIESFDDDRMRLIRNQQNRGLPKSLNRGVAQAEGKYIARMDADDRSLPERFEKQVELLESDPEAHVVGCWTRIIDTTGRSLGTKEYRQVECSPSLLKTEGPNLAHPSAMIRKSALQTVDGYREEFTYAQDLDLWIRMAREFEEDFIRILPEVLFERRITPGAFRKKPIQQQFAAAAGEPDADFGDREDFPDALSEKSQAFFYHYQSGRLLIESDRRAEALRNFFQAAQKRPFSPRPWYGIALTVLPERVRSTVVPFVSRYS